MATLTQPPKTPPTAGEPVWDIAKLYPGHGQWSDEEYLALGTNRLTELSDGSIEVLETPTEYHQDISAYLYLLLLTFVKASKLGKVLYAPFRVKIRTGKFREPDVLFMKAEHAGRRHNKFWDGADLVMEIVSDDDRDREIKRVEYAEARIPEYWIVDPMLKRVTVLTLAGDAYTPAGEYGPGEAAASVLLPGFTADVAAVFESK